MSARRAVAAAASRVCSTNSAGKARFAVSIDLIAATCLSSAGSTGPADDLVENREIAQVYLGGS